MSIFLPCPACGVLLVDGRCLLCQPSVPPVERRVVCADHPGLSETCAALVEARAEVARLRAPLDILRKHDIILNVSTQRHGVARTQSEWDEIYRAMKALLGEDVLTADDLESAAEWRKEQDHG